MFRVTLFALLIASAMAACPNKCNGHGTCGSADLCSCHPRWTGPDCSQRECPYGRSWTVDGMSTGTVPGKNLGGVHAYTECSSKGACDRTTGECQCYEGYSGRGCRRMACPNNCSGNGRCVSASSQNLAYTAMNASKFGSQTWDMDGSMVCACDRGYEGYDCSSRICPKGDDPVTDCSTGGAADANSLAHTMIQRLYVETTANESSTCLTEVDNYSHPVTVDDPTLFARHAPSSLLNEGANSAAGTKLKRMDGSASGLKCLHGAGSIAYTANGGTGESDYHTKSAGHFYGYISLKYTDMFGGEYFTRPILIDTSKSTTMTSSTDVPAYSTSYSSLVGSGNNLKEMTGWTTDQALLKMTRSTDTSFDSISEVETKFGSVTSGITTLPKLADVTKSKMLEGAHNSANVLRENLKRYTADRIRSALEELPNFAIPSVNVTNYYDAGNAYWGNVFDITFTDEATSGKQNLLECVYNADRACPGAQPRMANADPFGTRKHGLGYDNKQKRTHHGTCHLMKDDGTYDATAVSGVTTKEACLTYVDSTNNNSVGGKCMTCHCGRGDGETSDCNTTDTACYYNSVSGTTPATSVFVSPGVSDAITEESCLAQNGNVCSDDMVAYYDTDSVNTNTNGEACNARGTPAQWAPNKWVEAPLPINGETTFVNYCNVYEVPLATGKDYEENTECSNRGMCDGSTGLCTCFDGHTGEACSTQTVFF